MTNSRAKGAAFEREVASELFLLTGVGFKRNLEQTRALDQSDLIPDDPAFPFAIECKAYESGHGCKNPWKAQAIAAANKIGKIPCVVYKYNRRGTFSAMPLSTITAAGLWRADFASDEWFETTLQGVASIAAELMARRNTN